MGFDKCMVCSHCCSTVQNSPITLNIPLVLTPHPHNHLLFSIPIILLFLECHINGGIVQFVAFLIWPF